MKRENLQDVLDPLLFSRVRIDSNMNDANIVDGLFAIADAIRAHNAIDAEFLELEKERTRLDNEARDEVIGLLHEDAVKDTVQ